MLLKSLRYDIQGVDKNPDRLYKLWKRWNCRISRKSNGTLGEMWEIFMSQFPPSQIPIADLVWKFGNTVLRHF